MKEPSEHLPPLKKGLAFMVKEREGEQAAQEGGRLFSRDGPPCGVGLGFKDHMEFLLDFLKSEGADGDFDFFALDGESPRLQPEDSLFSEHEVDVMVAEALGMPHVAGREARLEPGRFSVGSVGSNCDTWSGSHSLTSMDGDSRCHSRAETVANSSGSSTEDHSAEERAAALRPVGRQALLLYAPAVSEAEPAVPRWRSGCPLGQAPRRPPGSGGRWSGRFAGAVEQ